MNPYKSIHLTAEQKHKMARSIQQPSKDKKKLNVRFIIYPAFIATALFLTFLWSNGNPTKPITVNQATSEVFNRNWTHEAFIKRTIVLWTVSLALLMATYLALIITAINPKNSIHFQSIRYVNEKMKSRKVLGIAIMPIVILLVYTCLVLISPWPILVLQAVILLLTVSFYFYLSAFCVRKSELEHKCPYCHKTLTKKEITWAKKCGSCKSAFDIRANDTIPIIMVSLSFFPFVLLDFNRYLLMGHSILIILAMIKILLRHLKYAQLK